MVSSARLRYAALSLFVLLLVAASCEEPRVLSVMIDSGDITLSVGELHTLTPSVEARGGASQAVTWLSASPGVASVTSAGVVQGLLPGTTEVVARSVFDPSKHDSVVATVVAGAVQKVLTVARAGSGTGTVTSVPAGIDCGEACTAQFDGGTIVTLTAVAAAGSTFVGWGGACAGTVATCTVSMTEAREVTAAFAPMDADAHMLLVSRMGPGSGSVTSVPAGIDCGAVCSASFAHGTSVTLTAVAAAGSSFAGWGGACSGTASTCTVSMTEARGVVATFDAQDHTLSVSRAGSGSGTVTSAPSGIDCGGTCSASFAHGTSVTLTANAAAGSTFAGWSGACAGASSTCTVSMTEACGVTATFDLLGPANDHFANRIVVASGSGSTTGSSVGATKEPGEPDHAGWPGGRSVWWSWTAPSTVWVRFDTVGSSFDTVLAVYSGSSVGALTEVASNDDYPYPTSRVTFMATAGVAYQIAVDGIGPGYYGDVVLRWGAPLPPLNDDFADRQWLLSSDGGSTTGSNVGATKEPGEPDHAGWPGGRSVWWSWTAPSSGAVEFSTDASGFESVVAVYTGSSLGALTVIATSADHDWYASSASFVATAGTTYHIAVDGKGASDMGDIALVWGAPQPPDNDRFADSSQLSGGLGHDAVSGTNFGASLEAGEPFQTSPGGRSVWFTWTAPVTGWVDFDTNGSSFNTLLGAYTGSVVNALSYIAWNDDVPALSPRSAVGFAVVEGVQYHIVIDGYNGDQGYYRLNYGGLPGSPPTTAPFNDAFANAIVLRGTSGVTTGNNVNATEEAGEPAHASGPMGGRSVWWVWTAHAGGSVTISTFGSTFDTLLAVYTGNAVNALTHIASNDDAGGGLQSQVTFTAVAGTTYRIAVDGYYGAYGNIKLNWNQ
jgi:hypothetical protein